MKKRLALFLICVFCISIAFSGCDLFALDSYKYLNQPVASITYTQDDGSKNTVNITKKELVESYNRNAESLSSNGYTGEKAVKYLVDYLINQKITLNEVQHLINEDRIAVTDADINIMYNSTYEAMVNLLQDYEDKVLKDWNIKPTETPADEKTSAVEYKPFEKQAELVKTDAKYVDDKYVDGEWVIKFINKDSESTVPAVCELDEIVDTAITNLQTKIDSSETLKEAYKRYIADLKSYEKNLHLSKVNSEIWEREVQRVYNNIQETQYIKLYELYLQENNETSPISINKILKYYETQMLASYNKYCDDITTYKTDILSSRSNVNYFFNSDFNDGLGDYFYVSHLLVKLELPNDKKQKLNDLEEAYNQNPYDTEIYQSKRNAILSEALIKENGVTSTKTVGKLLEELQGYNAEERIQKFQEYIYLYNEDTGNQNQEYDYIVGTEDSKMVESFTEASRELYNNPDKQKGDISGIVESTYGVHIVMYLNPVQNLFTINNPATFSLSTLTNKIDEKTGALINNDLDRVVNKIQNELLSQFNNKTLFDKIFETLNSDTFAVYESLNLEKLKDPESVKITYYTDAYNDLY